VKRSLWQKIKDVAMTDVGTLVRGIDDEAIEHLEQILLEADIGVQASLDLAEEMRRAARRGKTPTERELRVLLEERVREILLSAGDPEPKLRAGGGPCVMLLLGVNGTGKTTSAAKLALRYIGRGERVLLAATDTFRSGAQEQLRIWAERVKADFVGGQAGGDPAAVAFDAARAVLFRGLDRLVVDTAGRLHTQRGLMDELVKIDRVLGRLIPGAPHERLLVVDSTSGQNVLAQVREFGAALPIDALLLTKFDGTARAGTVVAVARELSVPVRYVGTGEGSRDLERFDVDGYVEKLLGVR